MVSEKEIKYYIKKLEVSEVLWNREWETIERYYKNERVDFSKYTEEQRKAVHSIDGNYLIVGGSGTGKTSTLIFRIKIMKEVYKINLKNILALNFYEKDAEDFKERCLQSNLKTEELSIFTFSSFCLKILRDKGESFKLLSKSESEILQRYLLRDFYRLDFEQYLNEKNYLEFKNLIKKANTIFETDKDFLSEIVATYKYIVVDNYHEIDCDKLRFLAILSKAGANIICAGDDCQCISQFKKGSYIEFLLFKKYFFDGKLIKFQKNFRLTKEILKFIDNIHEGIELKFQRGKSIGFREESKESVEVVRVKNLEDESEYIALTIKKLLKKKDITIGVICRNRSYFNLIEKSLKKYDIDYKSSLKNNLSDPEERFLALFNFFRLPSELNLESIRGEIKESSYEKQLKNRDILEDILDKNFLNSILQEGKTSIRETKYENLREYYYKYKNTDLSRDEKIKILLEIYKILYLERVSLEVDLARIERYLLDEKDLGIKSAVIYGISGKSENIKNKKIDVELETLYSSKGKNWDYLFFPTVLDGVYPQKNRDGKIDNLEDEKRVFYLGCSRAKSKLIMTYPKFSLINYRGEFKKSRFLHNIDEKVYKFSDTSFF